MWEIFMPHPVYDLESYKVVCNSGSCDHASLT